MDSKKDQQRPEPEEMGSRQGSTSLDWTVSQAQDRCTHTPPQPGSAPLPARLRGAHRPFGQRPAGGHVVRGGPLSEPRHTGVPGPGRRADPLTACRWALRQLHPLVLELTGLSQGARHPHTRWTAGTPRGQPPLSPKPPAPASSRGLLDSQHKRGHEEVTVITLTTSQSHQPQPCSPPVHHIHQRVPGTSGPALHQLLTHGQHRHTARDAY